MVVQVGAWWPAAGATLALVVVRRTLVADPPDGFAVILAAFLGGGLGALLQATELAPAPGPAGYAAWLLERVVRAGALTGLALGAGAVLVLRGLRHRGRASAGAGPALRTHAPWLVAGALAVSGVANPVWTRVDDAGAAYRAAAWADLVALVQAQERAHARTGVFSADPVSIGFFPSEGVTVVVEGADSMGFAAHARHRGATALCRVSLDRSRERQMELACDARARRF